MTASEPPAQNSSKVGRAPSVASAQRHRHAAPAQQQQKQQQQGGQGAVSDMQGLESQPTHSAGPIVDLRLAHTYVPGFACLLRGTVLILLLARFSQSVPVMMATATVLQVDRAVRSEGIFDSGAMLSAVLAAHALNVFRSDPSTHQLYLAQQALPAPATEEPPQSTPAADASRALAGRTPSVVSTSGWGRIAQLLLVGLSLSLVGGVDVPWIVSRWAIIALGLERSDGGSAAARASTVVVNGALLVAVIQTPLDSPEISMNPVQVIVRSYLFLALSLVWTYGVGVRDMIEFLTRTSRATPSFAISMAPSGKKGNDGGGRVFYVPTVVQSFVPCHLRFTHILLLPSGGPYNSYVLASVCAASGALCAWKIYARSARGGGSAADVPSPDVHHEYRSRPHPVTGTGPAGGGGARASHGSGEQCPCWPAADGTPPSAPEVCSDPPLAGGGLYVTYSQAPGQSHADLFAGAPQPATAPAGRLGGAGARHASAAAGGASRIVVAPLAGGMSMASSPIFTAPSFPHAQHWGGAKDAPRASGHAGGGGEDGGVGGSMLPGHGLCPPYGDEGGSDGQGEGGYDLERGGVEADVGGLDYAEDDYGDAPPPPPTAEPAPASLLPQSTPPQAAAVAEEDDDDMAAMFEMAMRARQQQQQQQHR